MKSVLLAAIAVGGVLIAAPASAQGVKIGILNDQSGVYADYGGKWSFEAAKMAVEDFGGEVLGQKIEIVSADHQNKPDLASAIARRWYEVEGVDMKDCRLALPTVGALPTSVGSVTGSMPSRRNERPSIWIRPSSTGETGQPARRRSTNSCCGKVELFWPTSMASGTPFRLPGT